MYLILLYVCTVVETKDHLKMDDLWNGLKSYSERQLRPLSQHVNRLKV